MKEYAINIADIVDEESGLTYRELNNKKPHNIPLGTLVEICFDDSYSDRPFSGLRLFVVRHDRDCDGTPLYTLSSNRNWRLDMYGKEYEIIARAAIETGFSENSLIIIK